MHSTIHNKILISFCLVAFIGLFSLQFASYRITEQNIDNIIKNDMIDTKKNIDLYLKQYFLVYNLELNSKTLKVEATNITRELSSEFGNSVEIYDDKGKLATKNASPSLFKDDEGIEKAMDDEISYLINNVGDKVIVNLTYPIKKDNIILGVIRYYEDYTDLYSSNERFKNITILFAIIIFIIILITSYFMSKIITKPVRVLTKSSEQISKGNFDIEINVKSKDEVGELARRFKIMIERIKEQISFMERERDHLRAVQKQNKAFFDNVSHEMKTPLTTILGYAQVLQDNGFTDKEFFEKGLSYIISESERLNNLIVDILELSKSSSAEFSYEFSKFNLTKLIEKTCDEMIIKSEKYGIDINCSIEDELFLYGDENRIKEVLINLIDNSIKYGDTNSTIEVLAYRERDKLIVTVKDTGKGIPEEELEHIYDPFYKMKESQAKEKGSVGLGLSIVKNIIEKHNGTINITSEKNKGTKVVLGFKGVDENAQD